MAPSRVLFQALHLVESGTPPPQGRRAAGFLRDGLLQRGALADREDLEAREGAWAFRLEIEGRLLDFRIRLLDLAPGRPHASNPLAYLEWALEIAPVFSGLARLFAPLLRGLASAPAVAQVGELLQEDPGISEVRWMSGAAYRGYLRRNRIPLRPESFTPFVSGP